MFSTRRSRRLLIVISLLISSPFTRALQCFWPDGSTADPSQSACNSTAAHSHCCSVGSTCLANGLCLAEWDSSLNTGACTDPTWADSSCFQQCLGSESALLGAAWADGSLRKADSQQQLDASTASAPCTAVTIATGAVRRRPTHRPVAQISSTPSSYRGTAWHKSRTARRSWPGTRSAPSQRHAAPCQQVPSPWDQDRCNATEAKAAWRRGSVPGSGSESLF